MNASTASQRAVITVALAVLVLAGLLLFVPPAEVEGLQAKNLRVNSILWTDQSDDKKVEALAPFVGLRDPIAKIERWIGPASVIHAHGPGFTTMSFFECDLVIGTYPTGEVYAFGYYDPIDAQELALKWLAFDDPVTWPMTLRKEVADSNRR